MGNPKHRYSSRAMWAAYMLGFQPQCLGYDLQLWWRNRDDIQAGKSAPPKRPEKGIRELREAVYLIARENLADASTILTLGRYIERWQHYRCETFQALRKRREIPTYIDWDDSGKEGTQAWEYVQHIIMTVLQEHDALAKWRAFGDYIGRGYDLTFFPTQRESKQAFAHFKAFSLKHRTKTLLINLECHSCRAPRPSDGKLLRRFVVHQPFHGFLNDSIRHTLYIGIGSGGASDSASESVSDSDAPVASGDATPAIAGNAPRDASKGVPSVWIKLSRDSLWAFGVDLQLHPAEAAVLWLLCEKPRIRWARCDLIKQGLIRSTAPDLKIPISRLRSKLRPAIRAFLGNAADNLEGVKDSFIKGYRHLSYFGPYELLIDSSRIVVTPPRPRFMVEEPLKKSRFGQVAGVTPAMATGTQPRRKPNLSA